ncbi:MAG: helix-hairpin-helix domain-containing protein [Methylovirgula sp.]
MARQARAGAAGSATGRGGSAPAIAPEKTAETMAAAIPDINVQLANKLREAASLLAGQSDSPFRIAAYRRAADAVAGLGHGVDEILETGGVAALDAIPGVGRGIAAALAEMIHSGRWTYLQRLRGAAEPGDLFRIIPGVGPKLAKLLHDELHVETLEQLEAALHDPKTPHIKTIGPRRIALLRASLATLLSRLRPAPQVPFEEPSVGLLLDIDAAYRQAAEAGELPMIAPKRFNPAGEAWLPIMHAERGPWHFTALYSNTARAHDLGKTKDWVVIYAQADHGGETQRTIVTETRGKLKGFRIVRGRERDCLNFYEASKNRTSAPEQLH